jgi:hypothetical protein
MQIIKIRARSRQFGQNRSSICSVMDTSRSKAVSKRNRDEWLREMADSLVDVDAVRVDELPATRLVDYRPLPSLGHHP